MPLNRKSISQIFIFIVLMVFPGSIYAQVQIIDTSGYVPYFPNYNLMIAASKGYDNEIKRLIEKGADISAETSQGATPLVLAVANNRLSAVKTLLAYNPDVNIVTSSFESPLLISVKNNNIEIAEALIRAGADTDFSDLYGVTSLHYASIYGYFYVADLLLYYSADIDKKATDGTTPLMAAVWAGHADITDHLIKNGANMEAQDYEGFTSFHLAAQNGDTLIMNILIKRGVDIYKKNIYRWDALDIAIKANQLQAVEMLLKTGKGWTSPEREALDPYVIAAKYRRKEIVNVLTRENVSGRFKREIDQIGISVSTRFTFKDIYSGFNLTFKEPVFNGGLIAGIDTKLWYTRVLIKQDNYVYYQDKDKSSIAYAGLFKEISLTDYQVRSNFSFVASLSAGYYFGNKLKGTNIDQGSRFLLLPSAGFKWSKNNFSMSGSVEYQKSEFYKIGPIWLRIGCSYNFFFDNIRAPGKTIKWY
jgi:ankyrin repeat protein